MRRRDFIHGAYRIIAAAMLCITLLLAGLYFALHTRTGMDWIAGKISEATGKRVELLELSGRLPLELRADSARIRNPGGDIVATISQPSIRLSLNILHAGLKLLAPSLADFASGTNETRNLRLEVSAPRIMKRGLQLDQTELELILTYGQSQDPVMLHAEASFERALSGDKLIRLEAPITYGQTNQQGRLNLAGLRLNDGILSGHVDVTETMLDGTFSLQHPRFEVFNATIQSSLHWIYNLFPAGPAKKDDLMLHLVANGRLDKSGSELLNAPASVSGNIHADIRVDGLPRRPRFDGYATWNAGSFRNIKTGTSLERIELFLEGKGSQLVLSKGESFDDAGGNISLSGNVDLENGFSPTWSLVGNLDGITLFRLIQTELPLDGAIRLDGDLSGTAIQGKVKLQASRFTIPKRLPPSIGKLPVVEINHPDPARNTNTNATPAIGTLNTAKSGYPLTFNIDVNTGVPLEISGRGLNSLWRGRMHLGGTASAIKLTGAARLIEGYVMLLGRRFQIETGVLDLDGAVPPRPRLNINAVTRVSDVTVRLAITGTTDRPQVRLASEPMLEEQDIMAMILFGKLSDTMTPWQAIALANGLRVISGADGDVTTIIDTGLEVLQVDQLDIRQDEEGSGLASVAVGKHIGRRIYIEGEKGFGNAEDLFKVTLELSPKLILETESSPRIREGVGIYWRHDF